VAVDNTEVRDGSGEANSGGKQLQLGDYQLVELLSGTRPQQLCLACVHREPIAGHPLITHEET